MKKFQLPSTTMIKGVKLKPLKTLTDSRGSLMEILRCDDSIWDGSFGQVYFTICHPGIVKGNHYHQLQIDHFCCIKGIAKIVLYDMREESSTYKTINEFYIGTNCQNLLKIPCGVAHGFTAVGTEDATILNITNRPYNYDDPDEYRIDPNSGEMPYNWHACKDG